MFSEFIKFCREIYKEPVNPVTLHRPYFIGNEKKYVLDAIDSTFVSSVGSYVNLFEENIAAYCGSSYAVACVNGTAALHTALLVSGIKANELVITQPLSFIATANAISYTGASPLFIDIDKETLGLSPTKLKDFLENECFQRGNYTYHRLTQKKITACIPMHTFGHPAEIDLIEHLCKKFNIILIEDAAESIGSLYKEKHTGTYGSMGVLSFNGNKTITCGGGGAIITNNEEFAKKAKHLTTQAKVNHPWEFEHDAIGYNYRMPNINAALACAQLEKLNIFINNKRTVAEKYKQFFFSTPYTFISEPSNSKSNYWLNAILLNDRKERDLFLKFTNDRGIVTRPAWTLTNKLNIYKDAPRSGLENAIDIENRLVNIPSSVILD